MIVFSLGVYSSGSTWVFNVIQEIVSVTSNNSIAVYAEDAPSLLASCSDLHDFTVVKCHAMDQKLMNLALMTGAKIITSVRDPRDCVLSLSQRFGLNDDEARQLIDRSVVAVASVQLNFDCLQLVYEDRFTENPATIALIADWLGVGLTDQQQQSIFAKYGIEQVRKLVQGFAEQGHTPSWFDPATHWHVNHVGDGKSGK